MALLTALCLSLTFFHLKAKVTITRQNIENKQKVPKSTRQDIFDSGEKTLNFSAPLGRLLSCVWKKAKNIKDKKETIL